jgi:hypothetical protein
VSELQDADYGFLPGTTPVLFLSNALEPMYTSRAQFDVLLARVRAGLADGSRALFIHHAGGSSAFGVYELLAGAGGRSTVRTLCKDTFLAAPKAGDPLTRYDTWFEGVTTTKGAGIPSCVRHPLLPPLASPSARTTP